MTQAHVVDASVTEMRPMAADDSFDKPSEVHIPIAPVGRSSYARIQENEPKSPDNSVLPIQESPFEEHKELHISEPSQ